MSQIPASSAASASDGPAGTSAADRVIAAYDLDNFPPTEQLRSMLEIAAQLYRQPWARVVLTGRDVPLERVGAGTGDAHLAAPMLAPDGTEFGRFEVGGGDPPQLQTRFLQDLAGSIVAVLELEVASREAFDAAERVAEAELRMADFAHKVAHNLNNPLAAIAMSLELIGDQLHGDPNPVLAKMMERANSGAVRLKAMIAELGATDLTRVEPPPAQ